MRILITLIVIVCLASCTIEKRLYRPGYHIETSIFSKSAPSSTNSVEPDKIARKSNETFALSEKQFSRELTVEASLQYEDAVCDTILLRNGKRILGKIEKIDPTSVFYKRCENPTGPSYVETIVNIDRISFSSGEVEVFDLNNKSTKYSSGNETDYNVASSSVTRVAGPPEKKVEPFGLASLTMLVLSFLIGDAFIGGSFLLSLGSIIMAILSLTRFSKESSKYKGRWMPIFVVGFWILMVLIVLTVLALAASYGM